MESLSLPILIAGAVALMVFAIAMAAKGLFGNEKRKLAQRLSTEGKARGGGASQLPLSITRNEETIGASAYMVRWRPLDGLHRMIIQAYPNSTVAVFLCIAGGCAFGMFMLASLLTNNLIISAVAFAPGCWFPFLMLTQKRRRPQRTLALHLPEAPDLLSRLLHAAHS